MTESRFQEIKKAVSRGSLHHGMVIELITEIERTGKLEKVIATHDQKKSPASRAVIAERPKARTMEPSVPVAKTTTDSSGLVTIDDD